MENPNEWMSQEEVRKRLLLAKLNNMKISINSDDYFRPVVGNPTLWDNIFDNCNNTIPPCNTPATEFFRPHYNNYIKEIYSIAALKDEIWCHLMGGEASIFHWYQKTSDCRGYEFGNPNYFAYVEMPPASVQNAILHFKTKLLSEGVTNQKFGYGEANHGKSLNSCTVDHQGITFHPPQYFNILTKDNVSFEASYYQFPENDSWVSNIFTDIDNCGPDNNWHYLANFSNIEFEKTITNNVQDMITCEGTISEGDHPQYIRHFHSKPNSTPNANWLWFQAYTSIIHGINGIWFFDLNQSWNSGEEVKKQYFDDISKKDRFDNIENFPDNYKKYLRFLAQELRLLVNWGLLSNDPKTIIASKTNNQDINCIVEPCINYLGNLDLPLEKKTENYGLRYTIRSNGLKTIMIISNPLNVAITTSLDFSKASNSIIQSSTGVSILFEEIDDVNSNLYKVNRNSTINLLNNTVTKKYSLPFTNGKKLNLEFGPMDTKIIEFNGTIQYYGNGWKLFGSNFGNGYIASHKVTDNSLFYTGDFDGGGDEEILCVEYTLNSYIDQMTLVKLIGNNWVTIWSNNGNPNSGNGIYDYRGNFIVGDFNGGGKDELLGNDNLTFGSWTTLFRFENGNWQWHWSDYGVSTHPIRPYKDKIYVGDFNGDGNDELLGCDLYPMSSGWTTSFIWNGSDFEWSWSDYGSNHAIRPYRNNLISGDYDGDGDSELLGIHSWATIFNFENGDWTWKWSTYGSNNFYGWNYPPLSSDLLIPGNIDTDAKSELLFIQTNISANQAMSVDLNYNFNGWSKNWATFAPPTPPFFDDWSINSGLGTNTKYILLDNDASLAGNEPEVLLAMRKYCNNYLVNLYMPDRQNKFSGSKSRLNNNGDEKTNKINIFPNPANDCLNIKVLNDLIKEVEVFQINGMCVDRFIVYPNNQIKIDLSNYNNGLYYIKILLNSDNYESFKFSVIK